MKVISLDCETNGLGGEAFAFAATVSTDAGEIEAFSTRCRIPGDIDPWVKQNVLPALIGMPITIGDYAAMLEQWRRWYARHRDGAVVIAHVAWPVEAKFLRDAHASNLFEGPYPLIDVAPLLLAAGHDPTSVDAYLTAHGLSVPDGSPHHPLYDARAAERAFRHLMAARALEGVEGQRS